ncbi:ABC transporter substrate-binding protein [Phreatobacter oligotrophus]|uniref:Peptide/nickel transport system substrate-binding protein n=1 Tax=Phreatobacter oligotrophus TaxID=1122261 RepID=A0A2T4ZF22_9HYPH|nr:peptide/nickel transport system substrate-binding protein [Phreatobacter oligotrophus]
MTIDRIDRRDLMKGLAAASGLAMLPAGAAQAQEKVIRYGISMADIPQTTGQPDRGAGGYQFTGHTLYDPLVAWEMNVADRPGKLVPGLATSWATDPADKKKWVFKLRDGVKFHDGSAFDADAVIWNFEKVLNNQAPHFDQRQSSQVRARLPSVASYRKVDAMTVEVTTRTVDAFFPYQMLWFLVSSPAQFEKVGRDWQKFALQPSGTGPFRLARLQPREFAELVRNPDYWDKSRIAKADRIVLSCLPEPITRTNAMLAGTVDFIEAPAPDVMPRLRQAGFRLIDNVTPHVWNYHLSTLPGSPWTDIRTRRAANLAIDRASVVELMGGLAKPAYGQVDRTNPWFGKPSFEIKYDVDGARKLMTEAGYSRSNPLKTQFIIASSGSGQMLSLPINELCQQMFKEAFIEVDFRVVELEPLYQAWRQGAAHESLRGITANNVAYLTSDPLYAFIRFFHSGQIAPVGVNWGHYKNPDVDKLIDDALATTVESEQNALMAKVHEKVVDDALLVWVVHDTNPHVANPKVSSYTQAQHWFQDLTTLG